MTEQQQDTFHKIMIAVLTALVAASIAGLVVLYGEHSVLKAQVSDLRVQSIEREARTRQLETAVVRIGEELRAQNFLLRGIARQVGAPAPEITNP